MKKFWMWNQTEEQAETPERTLVLRGVIAEDSWLDDKVTPGLFKEELDAGEGNVTVWINSPGGDGRGDGGRRGADVSRGDADDPQSRHDGGRRP